MTYIAWSEWASGGCIACLCQMTYVCALDDVRQNFPKCAIYRW